MNNFDLNLIKATDINPIVIDDYEFKNASLIELSIDSKSTWQFPEFDEAIIVLSELVRSLNGDGTYLIFTSVTGIADEGGWEGVNIAFKNNSVLWTIEIGGSNLVFEFDNIQYRSEIMKVVEAKKDYPLEPTNLYLPEHWN
ncbi:hypothetical protein ACTXMK_10120 [Psychrobacter celer]|uniref:hypothetical protein n=1 Tax=Psychrobacter celer TaxID=306572 RepID=UPI003FD5D309